MRQYYQGTLDFSCGVYAVINALSLTHSINLEQARAMYAEVLLELSGHPDTWENFLSNKMDHYGVIHHMLWKYCHSSIYKCQMAEPFGNYFTNPWNQGLAFNTFYVQGLPENNDFFAKLCEAQESVWSTLCDWFHSQKKSRCAALLRFHRFMLGAALPYVSHWTTVKGITNNEIVLFDASAEKKSLHSISKEQVCGGLFTLPGVCIEPSSIVFLERID